MDLPLPALTQSIDAARLLLPTAAQHLRLAGHHTLTVLLCLKDSTHGLCCGASRTAHTTVLVYCCQPELAVVDVLQAVLRHACAVLAM